MRTKKKRWKRECGLHAKSTCGPGEKDGHACVDCLPRRQEAQARKMETHVQSACYADKGHKKKRWKRAFARFAMLPCEQRKAVETRGRVACHMSRRPRTERWKREFRRLVMPTSEPSRTIGQHARPTWAHDQSTLRCQCVVSPGCRRARPFDGVSTVGCRLPRRREHRWRCVSIFFLRSRAEVMITATTSVWCWQVTANATAKEINPWDLLGVRNKSQINPICLIFGAA